MKFSDGNWLTRPGIKTHYPAEAYDVEVSADALTLMVPTHHIRHRGDTLGGVVLTVRLSSPHPDVIRVQMTRYIGGTDSGPHFPLTETPTEITTEVTDETAILTSGKVSVVVSRKNWSLQFLADGQPFTSSPGRSLGLVETTDNAVFSTDPMNSLDLRSGRGIMWAKEELTLGVGECVYGLGERFSSFVKNGQTVEIWNKDGGTGSDQTYKNIPFYLTNRGYGVFINQPENVSVEVATEKVSRVQFSVPGETLDYLVIYGPTPKEILAKYTSLTRRPPLPPAWSFGLWLTTSFTTNYDEQTVTGILQEMTARELPLSVFHFDCFWMREFRWCDFTWDERVFPDPVGMLQRLHERGLKICVWINPYIAQLSPLFAEGKAGGYLLKQPNGDVWQTDLWQPGMALVDFTNPAACEWYASKLRGLVGMGVDSFKTDFGERVPVENVVWHDGSDPLKMHNFYPYLYNKVVFDVLRQEKGEGEAVLFARSATAGGQQFPVHWGGDCYSSFESMAETLRGGLSLCLSGFGFWSHDIGGFEGKPPVEVYKRWIAFGLLSSHSRLHGSGTFRVPWLFDEEAVDVLRFFTVLKCRLMPYLFGKAIEATQTGTPMLRAMALEFPGDPNMDYLDRQFMLGDSLLVAPVFDRSGNVEFFVPEGRWTSYLTGAEIVGPRWVRETHGFLSVPLLVRPNTLLAVGNRGDRPDYDYNDGTTFRLYALADGANATAIVPTVAGGTAQTVTISRTGDTLSVTRTGTLSAVRLVLVNVTEVTSDGANTMETPEGASIEIPEGTASLTLRVGG